MHTNQKLLVEELLKRGATFKVLDEHDELLEITYKSKKDYLLDRFSSEVSFHIIKMLSDKHFTKKILNNNNINTAEGNIYSNYSIGDALRYAKDKYPIIIKPNWGSHGDGVVVNIENEEELKSAINNFYKNNNKEVPFILEKFYPWKEYRLFITSLNEFAVIHRDCANIVGDGVNNIEKLIKIENIRREILKKEKNTSLCPIVIDNEVMIFLRKKSLNYSSYIPRKEEKVYLRQESNLAKGGISINMTKEMPIFFKELSFKILSIFPNLKLAGLDILCEDIYAENPKYIILEVNSNPGLTMHHYPAYGESENVAKYVCDVMFQDWF